MEPRDPPGLDRRAGCVKGITTPIQEALQRAAPYTDPGMTRGDARLEYSISHLTPFSGVGRV